MKIFFVSLWRLGCILLALIFLFSCFTQFIPSHVFSYAVFLALLFPYLFLAVLCVAIFFLFKNRKWSLFFFLLLIPGLYNFVHVLAFSPFTWWHMEKTKGDTRIMTWNVSSFINPALLTLPDAEPRRQMLNTIADYNPDILCIQEYDNVTATKYVASVKDELDSMGYHYVAFSKDHYQKTEFGQEEQGVAILTKTPFLDSGRLLIRNAIHTEYLQYVDIMIQNKPVRINTAHLASFYLFPENAKGYPGKKNTAKKLITYKHDVQWKLRGIEILHDKQATEIRQFLDTCHHPLIYCGDCNATSAMYSYRLLKGNKQDAFLKKGNGLGTTFYKMAPTLRIDVCLLDRVFDVTQCTVAQKYLGDHNPVIADFHWKQ